MTTVSPDIKQLFNNVPEHPERHPAEVTGEIPEWVDGTLLRNGPGVFSVGPDEYKHLFDGLAIIQRYHITNGQVDYSTKYLRSDTYEKNMKAQRIVVSEFGTIGHPDPCKNILQRYLSHFAPSLTFTDNDLVAFVQCGDQVYASSETARLNRIDPDSLDVTERVDMRKYIAINTATAHPHYDKDGNTYNMGNSLRSYKIIFVPRPQPGTTGNAFENSKIVANIMAQSSSLSYYHSFGMSENFIIFPEMPMLMNPFKMVSAACSITAFSSGIEWKPNLPTKIHLVNRGSGEPVPIKYTACPFFTFHHINAYEENGCAVVDAVVYLDGEIIHALNLQQIRAGHFPNLSEEKRGFFRRLVLPLTIPDGSKPGENLLDKFGINTEAKAVLKENGEVQCEFETLFSEAFELPRINYDNYNGRIYKYCYGVAFYEQEIGLRGAKILKFDIPNRKILEWRRDHIHQFASEPVFVPRPDAQEEDDGMNVCEGPRPKTSNLSIEISHVQFRLGVFFATDLSNEITHVWLPQTDVGCVIGSCDEYNAKRNQLFADFGCKNIN